MTNECADPCINYSVDINENNTYLIHKLLYYFEMNSLCGANHFRFNGILDVRGKKLVFLIPVESFNFLYGEFIITYNYTKFQQSEADNGNIIHMERITLACKSLTNIKDFLYDIEKLEFEIPENKLIKYIWNNTYWKYCNGFRKRTFDTLYLPAKQKDRIINEITQFLAEDSHIYERLCIPARKIFLFWGIPGSGKTTFIRTIASRFNKNIAIVKATQKMDDSTLEAMLEELPKDSLILFEDIDSLFQGRTNVANTQITFSGLLNFLDGIIDYDKLLIFITTNNLNDIDDALRRRIDIFLEFTYMEKEEIFLMFDMFFEQKYSRGDFYKQLKRKVTANALEKYFTKCIVEELSPLANLDVLYSYLDMTKKNMPALYI